jgi:hypothetical protein
MTKNEALATKVNKSKGAIGSKAKAMTAEDALAMVLADPAAMAKLAAALKK